MRKSTALALLGVVLLAILLRLLPLTWSLYWGADYGEYFTLTRQLAESGHVPETYAGWGTTYPSFPGLLLVVGSLATAGLHPAASLSLVPPVLAALSVLGVFLLGAHMFRERRTALLAAGIVAVLMPHVYGTSHPTPGAVGDLLFVFALLALLRARTDRRWWVLYLLLALGLILTHHLTTYFLLIATGGHLLLTILIRREVPMREMAAETGALLTVATLAMAYWTLYATPFRENILPSVTVVPWWALVALFLAAIAALPLLGLARRRWSARYAPRWPSRRRSGGFFVLTLAATLTILAYGTLVTIPGTTIPLSPWIIPMFLPVLALFSLAPAGRKFSDFHRDGLAPTAWTLALLASILVGIVLASRVIIPYRHMQYIVVPLALLAALGAVRLVEQGRGGGRRYVATTAALAVVIVATIPAAYPPAELMGGFNEGANPRALSSVLWIGERAHALVLSDHFESSLTFGFGGVDATWDRAPDALLAESFDEARPHLLAVDAPAGVGRVDYALLTIGVEAGAMTTPWAPAAPMSPQALAKFDALPFQRLYDDGYGRAYVLHWALA